MPVSAIENPSPRWSLLDCLRIDADDRPDVCHEDSDAPEVSQEMAWSSPIRYRPARQAPPQPARFPNTGYGHAMNFRLANWRFAVVSLLLCAACGDDPISTAVDSQTSWLLIDDFESGDTLARWTNIDVENDTDPHVPNPQVSEIRREPESGNRYMLRKPAADGVVGNRKAIGFTPLPVAVPVGATWTFYTRINVEYFPNNQSFGLVNVAASDIPAHHYDSFEPMIRVTDKPESDGYKNDGTLMVSSGWKSYSRIRNPATGEPAQPMEPGVWYELWYVVNNAERDNGGQRFDVYLRGGEFDTRTLVFEGADFRMQRALPLTYFMAISNTGPHDAPYGNGGVRYDDIYMAAGRTLSSPLD